MISGLKKRNKYKCAEDCLSENVGLFNSACDKIDTINAN